MVTVPAECLYQRLKILARGQSFHSRHGQAWPTQCREKWPVQTGPWRISVPGMSSSYRPLVSNAPDWQLDKPCAQYRQFAILIMRRLFDLDQMTAVLLKFADHLAVNEQQVALGIMPADLAGRPG